MKTAQEFRVGSVMDINGEPWVVLKAEFNKSGRNASVMKMKLKSLLSSSTQETVFRADDKFNQVILERKQVTYSYFADPLYVFMDAEYNPVEVEAENMGDVINYIVDGMTDECQATFYEGKAISIELPIMITRKVVYTEPAVRGDTSGKVMKVAKLDSGIELSVASFIEIGDDIEIDTRTGEFKGRAKA